jgi:hypothetical protein
MLLTARWAVELPAEHRVQRVGDSVERKQQEELAEHRDGAPLPTTEPQERSFRVETATTKAVAEAAAGTAVAVAETLLVAH